MKTFILALSLVSTQAFAWGPTGHRVVGEVANKFLTPDTVGKVHRILKGEGLARVSTWPDDIKSEPATYSHTFNWHYTTWADEAHDHSAEREDANGGFLLKEINENLSVLKDPKATEEKKAFSLKFIVHLIGDLHMPLHVGGGNDQGGNFCKVTFHGKSTNLHQLWDEGMIDFTNLSFTELARFVSEGRKLTDIQSWKSGDILSWAQESKTIRATLYPEDVTASAAPVSVKKYCLKDAPVEDIPKLGYEYSYKFMPVVEQRLYQAGLRLALLLNQNLQ